MLQATFVFPFRSQFVCGVVELDLLNGFYRFPIGYVDGTDPDFGFLFIEENQLNAVLVIFTRLFESGLFYILKFHAKIPQQ